MGKIKAIRSEADYKAALDRIDAVMNAEPGTPEGEELDVLTDLVEHYEEKHVPMGFPSPVAAIEFRLEQAGLTQRDLIPFIGSRAKVSEVLSGKRPLTMPMARALHEHFGIPAEVLLQQPGATFETDIETLDWDRFPLKSLAKVGWIPTVRNLGSKAEELIRGLIDRAGGPSVASAILYRKGRQARANAKTDPYALKAWCWRVLGDAKDERLSVPYRRGSVTLEFLRELAQLSWLEEGPRVAKEFLAKHGIPLVVLPHLPKTYLDGAALKLADGTPVIGLTLRYDRIDNFWFCLLHELAHVGRHMDVEGEAIFVDDLTLRDLDGGRDDPKEIQADEWAEEALIPRAMWESSAVRQQPTPMSVISLANALKIHPAIVAGRIRHEQKNYRLLSQFVGTGEVRRCFGIDFAGFEENAESGSIYEELEKAEDSMVPHARFAELLADIEPSPTTKSNASVAHTAVRKHLRCHPTFKNRWEGDFLAGSYARDTAIRPRQSEDGVERPDVDIIMATNFSTSDDPEAVLQEVSDALADEFTVERINKRSVRVITTNAEIDVVPVVAWGSAYQLPDRDLGSWKATNPSGHNDWSLDQNDRFDGRFKPLVKLFKSWRRENRTGKRPKGFVLEVLVSLHAPVGEKHYGEAFATMLESIYSSYGPLAERGFKPTIDDPSVFGSDILSKVSITDWKNFMERLRVHAGYARRAQDETDMEEATRLWRKLFGDRFRATANAAKAASLAGFAAAPAGSSSGYTFPNAPAAPTQPRGFA